MAQALSPEQLNAQYNNRALVPDFQRHFDSWVSRSELARQQPCLLDVRYGSSEGETLDIFPAKHGAIKAPVMVFIHGGYWRSLDKSNHSFVAPAFTTEGVCVVVANYALCPQVTIPQIAMQMVKALAWVHDHIGDHGGDAANITLVGHSAGGHLAAMLLACDWVVYRRDLPGHLVTQALSISGLFDLEPIRRTPFLQDSLRLTSAQVRQTSPAYLKAPAGKMLYAVVGGAESAEFIRQNKLIAQHWGNAVVPVCEILAGRQHFSALDALVEPGHRLHELCLSLVKHQSP
jgi:arylformamidase